MATLPVDFLDDILNASMNGKRKYRITHADGSTEEVILEDVSEYDQVGSNFGAAQVNQTNEAVNEKLESADVVDPMVATEEGFAADAKKTGDALSELNKKLPVVYKGEIASDYLTNVRDNTFVYNPHTKRVDFQVIGSINKNILDWTQLVKIPKELPPKELSTDSYCGTVLAYDGTVSMCYISPSSNGYLAPIQIGGVAVNTIIKLFGSYYTE